MRKKIAFISSNLSIFTVFLLNHIKILSDKYDIYVYVNLGKNKEKKI